MKIKTSLVKVAQELFSYLSLSGATAFARERRFAIQITQVRGQNLQMMGFAEPGRPSLRAHLVHPWVARVAPDNRTVVRILSVSYWLGTTLAYALAILVGVVGAAVASHFTPG
ncbi:MAG: hypothetical protein WC000_13870 [Dokdonella sp.]